MTAFGPYKETEVIDFTELNEHHLYVISGATGAGKTTIFDGICFALYGSASGSDRENTSMLRSHFADDSVHTAVELLFELNAKTYRVMRQLGHVKKGNKTRTGERYEFFEVIDGKEYPCVDRQIVSEINEKIVQLIGLTHDQFKQIVMLPQGEFRKLLTSETENKEDILRKLFKTARFKQMNELLKEKRDQLQNSLATDQQLIEHYITNIPEQLEKRDDSTIFKFLEQENYHVSQIIQSLDSEIIYYNEKISNDEKEYKHISRKYNEQQKIVFEATEINKKFIAMDQKQSELQHLQNQQQLYTNKENILGAAKRANAIEPYEKHFIERKKELMNQEKVVKEAKNQLNIAVDVLNKAKVNYVKEENKENEREQVKRDLDKYMEFLPVVKEIEQTREKLKQYEKSQTDLENEIKLLKKKISTKKENLENRNKKIKDIEQQVSELHKKQTEIVELRIQYKILNEYEQLLEEETSLRKLMKQKEQLFQKANETYVEHEKVWIHNQAYALASHLNDGDDCPVCGSVHHPKKAEPINLTVTKDMMDKLKKDLEEKREDYNKCFGKYNSCYDQLQKKAKEIVEEYNILEDNISERKKQIYKIGKDLRSEVEQLEESAKTLEKLRKLQQDEEIIVKNNETELQKQEEAYQKEKTLYIAENATFRERIRNIPKEVQQLGKLESFIKTLKQKVEMMEHQWKTAQNELKTAEENYTKANLYVLNGDKQLSNLEEVVQTVKNKFFEQLQKAEFASEQLYREAKLSEDEQNRIQKEIEDYKKKVHIITNQISELKDELKGKERLNVEALEAQLKELKDANDQAFEQLNKSKELLTTVNTLQKNLVDVHARTENTEKELSTVIELYDILRGQNNRRVSLERYLQIDFLEQIMNAANGRFRNLTNGQYYLLRSDRQETHGRQSGLAIDVYDAYTVQTRDVKTLSGGEKFIASLCLALGMADVIQSYQGSVSIETMFIDEGFGSLDEESLHKSIDALINLQQDGRTIGVISHVEELKTIFPAMLEVSKSQEGYSKTKFVVK